MALAFKNRNLTVPDLIDNTVHFRVKVNRERCPSINPEIEVRLESFEKQGLEISLSELITSAGSHWQDGALDHLGLGAEVAEVQAAWSAISHFQPRAELHRPSGKHRLLVTPFPKNPEVTKQCSQTLGVGIGLCIATRLYEIPLQSWSSTREKPYDFETFDSQGNQIVVEVRGRFNRNHWKEALNQVHKKFKSADFSKAAGIIFAPHDKLRRNSEDIEILDPEGNCMNEQAKPQFRSLLRHYAPFFERQNFQAFGQRLRDLSEANDEDFHSYLEHGDKALKDAKPYRTVVRYNQELFKGTAWAGTSWPKSLTGLDFVPENGVFYWALWEKVIEALKCGHLQDIAEMRIRHEVDRVNGCVGVLLEDATFMAWAPNEDALKPSMFEE